MTLNADQMPTRKQYPVPADLERALQEWQARNTLPTEKIIPPADGTMTVLQVRKSSGAYTHTVPKP
ncbi:MAG: hypothetical protein WC851_02660 [Candidatus Shapirobacteria bacterium]|jgi:hypothetical protein